MAETKQSDKLIEIADQIASPDFIGIAMTSLKNVRTADGYDGMMTVMEECQNQDSLDYYDFRDL